MNRLNFGVLRKTVTDAVSSAAYGARDLALEAKEALEKAITAKNLRPYTVKGQTATSGPKGLWKIYTADYKQSPGHYPYVSVWILEKKPVQDAAKACKSRYWDTFLEQQKTGANLLSRLKHPGILNIVEPLEETRTQLIMVTEPVFCSLSDWTSYFSLVPNVSEDIRDVTFSELEVKHGLLQVASGLQFLHYDANLTHCSLSPESVILCDNGRWVLANLGFSIQTEFTGSKSVPTYGYGDTDLFDQIITRPDLQYAAPELVNTKGGTLVNVTPAVDMYSLGLLSYSSLTRVSLISCADDVSKYKAQTAFVSGLDFSALPSLLKPIIEGMLSPAPSSRPPLASFTECPYFTDDILLRAIQFLDGIVGKDSMQKASFLKDLDSFWTKMDARIIRNKVLPPLLQELNNPALQALIIPFIFKAAGRQEKAEFEMYTLPKLKTLFETLKGDALLIVMTHCEHLTQVMSKESVSQVLLPLFLKSFDDENVKTQDEALRKCQGILTALDFHHLKTEVLPRIHTLSMKTVLAKVRINSLVIMGTLIPRLGKEEAKDMIQTCSQIAMVDKSPGTLMCILGIGDTISKHWGHEITSEFVLPLLCPLLTASKISHSQFNTFLTVIREMLSRVEEKRGKQLMQTETIVPQSTKAQDEESGRTWDTMRRSSLPSIPSSNAKIGNGIQTMRLDDINVFGEFSTISQSSSSLSKQPKSSSEDLLSNVQTLPVPSTLSTASGDMDFFAAPLFTSFPNNSIKTGSTTTSALTQDPFASLLNPISQPRPPPPRPPAQTKQDPFLDLLS